jgi:hypothetical protein
MTTDNYDANNGSTDEGKCYEVVGCWLYVAAEGSRVDETNPLCNGPPGFQRSSLPSKHDQIQFVPPIIKPAIERGYY